MADPIPDNVEIYLRPIDRPVASFGAENVRINYRGHWVDFSDGEIQIRDIYGHIVHSTVVK